MSDTNVNLPLQGSLVSEAKDLALKLKMPWHRLVVMALQDFIRRSKGREQLQNRFNAAYGDEQEESDLTVVRQMRGTHRKLLEDEW